jgi:genome maintenance exonuclease 1
MELKTIENSQGRFYITPDGKKYPSITTLLSTKEKPGLVEWRNSLGAEAAAKETKRAAERGTAVHAMLELFLKNDTDPVSNVNKNVPISVNHVAEFNSIKRYIQKHVNNIVLQESALYSDTLKVAGRVDCIAEWDGKLSVIDFKTSTNNKNKQIIEDYFLQTTAYALMFEEIYKETIEQVVIIISVEKGIVPLIYKESVDSYMEPLVRRINTYYKKQN